MEEIHTNKFKHNPVCRTQKPKSPRKTEGKFSHIPITWPLLCPKCSVQLTGPDLFYSHMLDHWTHDTICPMCNEPKAVKIMDGKKMVSRNNFKTHLKARLVTFEFG